MLIRHLLNQGGWKHSASDTSSTQDSNSLEGHGQGRAGQNGAWGSDCEATWADEIGQCHAMVTVTKPNGKIRVCIDPRDRAILMEHFPWKLLKKLQLRCLEPRFSAIRCYIWILADLTRCWEFAKLCTFNSPFGRHRFTQMSFEIKSAPEVFQRAISEMLQDLDGTEAIIDIIVWGTTAAENDKRSNALLDRARQHNLKLSMDRRSERVDLRGTYLQIYWLASETRPW